MKLITNQDATPIPSLAIHSSLATSRVIVFIFEHASLSLLQESGESLGRHIKHH